MISIGCNVSNWGDIAAFQNAAAARATASAAESAAWEARKMASAQQSLADAQARTAQEQARANQIMIEAEEKKNLELKRQIDELQNFAKRHINPCEFLIFGPRRARGDLCVANCENPYDSLSCC